MIPQTPLWGHTAAVEANDCRSHAEKNYEDVTRHDRTLLVGLCSGMFAASAIASTPSLSTLVPVAVQAVLLAFRTGSYVYTLGERLSPAVEQSESWTYIFPGLKEDDATSALDEFHQQNVSTLDHQASLISCEATPTNHNKNKGCTSSKPCIYQCCFQ